MSRLAIYSLRYSVARGYHYSHERDVQLDTAARWLTIYQNDEPCVEFIVSTRKPIDAPRAHAFAVGPL